MSGFESLIGEFANAVFDSLCKDDRFKFLTRGLAKSLQLTLIAAVIGVFLGMLIAVIRMLDTENYTGNKFLGFLRKFSVGLTNGYVSLIRGTPAVVQLMVIYFIVFRRFFMEVPLLKSVPDYWIAGIAFGMNSAAYVSEIIRAGISAVDKGQMEAGRSLGLSNAKTMIYIIVPQAVKNVLPALGNEFIVLLKETSIAGYIGVEDLTRGAQSVGSIIFNYIVPLVCAAYIYFLMTTVLSTAISAFERRLHRSD